jgi:hypothetical protein
LHLSDVVSYGDFPPTDSQLEVHGRLTQEIARDREQMSGIMTRILGGFNETLRSRQLGAIVAPRQ